MAASNDQGCGCLFLICCLAGFGIGGSAIYRINEQRRDEENAAMRTADHVVVHLRELISTRGTSSEFLHESFWPPGEARYAGDGYMISDKFIPLRAIARQPNVSLFRTEQLAYPGEVVGVMKPWQPYYVFKRVRVVAQGSVPVEKKAMWIGDRPQAVEADRKWVAEDDCFCWTTRECINVESPIKVYSTLEDAEQDRNPCETAYTFPYADHFESGQTGREEQAFRMASLPVLRRNEGGLWCFVRPEGTEAGYQVCWIRWDGEDPQVRCRIRISRLEFEEYLIGVRQLMIDYRSPEKSASAKQELYMTALNSMAHASELVDDSLNVINARREGIPKLTGFLEMPIESPLQYELVSERVVRLLQLSLDDIWDIVDVAFIPAENLP